MREGKDEKEQSKKKMQKMQWVVPRLSPRWNRNGKIPLLDH